MRVHAAAPLLLAALLLVPAAAAWRAEVSQPVDASLSVRTSLLLAGSLEAAASGAPFALASVDLFSMDEGATVRVCPDRAGEPDPDCLPTPATASPGASLRVLSGGVVLQPLDPGRVEASVRAGPALLGGGGIVLNRVPTGPALFAAGDATLRAQGSGFLLRPLDAATAIEVRAPQGTTLHEGTAYTLRLTGAEGLRLEGRGAVLGLREGDGLVLARGGPAEAESRLRLDDLLRLQRQSLPPEQAPRRAHLADAFGPFQLVPSLLDGALAAHANLTVDGTPQREFLMLRVDDARLWLHEGQWRGTAEAAYVVQGDVVAAHPGARVDPPLLVPLLLAALALAGRALTRRETPPAPRRRLALALRLGGLLLLALLADLCAAPLLGVHPLLDPDALSMRSRVQLGLLVAGMALSAYGLIGLAAESLSRTALATRGRPAALLAPVGIGLAAAATLLLLGHAALLSLVARLVRL